MAKSGVANWFEQHGIQITQSMATYIISSSMSVFGVSVQRTDLDIKSLLASITPGVITTYIERSAMATRRQPIPNSRRDMLTEDSMCCDIFAVLWVTSRRQTSSIQGRSACLTTSRSGFSTSWAGTKGSASTMQSGYPCLLTITSLQSVTKMRKFLIELGRRWRKWAGIYLEL